MSDRDWMALALAEARSALAAGEVPVGAVLVRDGKVISRAHNRREERHDPCAHAEILCLREAGQLLGDWRLKGCTLYVTLEPCPMCAGAMVISRLSRCVFAASDPAQGCCGSVYDLPGDPALGGQTRWEEGPLAEESQQLLRAFFQNQREET